MGDDEFDDLECVWLGGCCCCWRDELSKLQVDELRLSEENVWANGDAEPGGDEDDDDDDNEDDNDDFASILVAPSFKL